MTGKAAAASDTPFGMFDAILSMFSAPPAKVVEGAERAVVASSFQPVVTGELPSTLAALLGQIQQTPPAGEVADLVAEPTAPQAEQAVPVPAMFRDLIDQLTALQDQLGETTAIDPLTEKGIEDTLDTLAAALGITLPASTPAAPEATAAAVTLPAAALPAETLDPLAAISTVATVPAPDFPALGSMVPADGESAIVVPTTVATSGPAAADTTAAQPLAPAVQNVVDKLAELAEAVSFKAPELARKLEAFASKLAAGEIDTAELAKLGLDPAAETADADVAAAIERLLASRPEAKPASSPVPFSAATLVLPDLGQARSSDKPTDAAKPVARGEVPAETIESDAETDTPTVRSAERADKLDAQPQGRNSFSTAFQASLSADAQPQQTATPAAAVGVAVVGTAVAADTKAIHAAYRAPVQQINMPQMAVEIVRQVEAGNSRFQIRLDPPELGRIDVKLDVDKAGNVSARMTVERAETLDLMQRDQRSLEKALAQAGLDSSKTNLEFSLRQSPFGRDGQPQQQGGDGQPAFPRFGVADADDTIPAPHVTAYRGYASASGVNLFV